jgi:hypothetical protein
MAKTPARRIVLNLKPRAEYVEGLHRYCAFFEMTMTGFLERKIRHFEGKLLERLSPEQKRKYFAGELKFADFTEAESEVWRAPNVAFEVAAAASRAALPKFDADPAPEAAE